ncbi:hypothetical protein [Holospora elegans]|nr:hypothetical protein [Holospora elegans]
MNKGFFFMNVGIGVSLWIGIENSYGVKEGRLNVGSKGEEEFEEIELKRYDFKGKRKVFLEKESGILTGLEEVEELTIQEAETIIIESPILKALDIRIQAKEFISTQVLNSQSVMLDLGGCAWIGKKKKEGKVEGNQSLTWKWSEQDQGLVLAHRYEVISLGATVIPEYKGRLRKSEKWQSWMAGGWILPSFEADLDQGWQVGKMCIKGSGEVWCAGLIKAKALDLGKGALKISGAFSGERVNINEGRLSVQGAGIKSHQGWCPITGPGAACIKDITGTGELRNEGGMVYIGGSKVVPVFLHSEQVRLCSGLRQASFFPTTPWEPWTFVEGTLLQKRMTGSCAGLLSGRWGIGGFVGNLPVPSTGWAEHCKNINEWMRQELKCKDSDWMDEQGRNHFSNFSQGNRVWIQKWAPDIGGQILSLSQKKEYSGQTLKKGILIEAQEVDHLSLQGFEELLIIGTVCASHLELKGNRLLHMGDMQCKDVKIDVNTWHQWSGMLEWNQMKMDLRNEAWDSWSVLGQVRCYGHIRNMSAVLGSQDFPVFKALSNLSCFPSLLFSKGSFVENLNFSGKEAFLGDGLIVRNFKLSGTAHTAGNTEICCLDLEDRGKLWAGPQTVPMELRWVRGEGEDHRGTREWWEGRSGFMTITPPAHVEIHRVQGKGEIINKGGYLTLHGIIDQSQVALSSQCIALLPSAGQAQRSGLRAEKGTLFGSSGPLEGSLVPETNIGGALMVNNLQALGAGRYFVCYVGSTGGQTFSGRRGGRNLACWKVVEAF